MTTVRREMVALLALTCLMAPQEILARPVATGGLRVVEAWIAPMPAGALAAVGYLSITNAGRAPDRLMAAETTMATGVSIHLTTTTAGITRMRSIEDGVPLPPGQTVVLRPGGYHLMFEGPRRPLRAGDHIPVRLKFERAPSVPIDFVVRSLSGRPPPVRPMSMPGAGM
jgi:copper(I)-binding protein